MTKLTDEQLAFLRLHARKPAPHAWAWQGGKAPNWTHLHAKRHRSGRSGPCETAVISKEGLAGLEPYWERPLLELNAAGLAAVEDLVEA